MNENEEEEKKMKVTKLLTVYVSNFSKCFYIITQITKKVIKAITHTT